MKNFVKYLIAIFLVIVIILLYQINESLNKNKNENQSYSEESIAHKKKSENKEQILSSTKDDLILKPTKDKVASKEDENTEVKESKQHDNQKEIFADESKINQTSKRGKEIDVDRYDENKEKYNENSGRNNVIDNILNNKPNLDPEEKKLLLSQGKPVYDEFYSSILKSCEDHENGCNTPSYLFKVMRNSVLEIQKYEKGKDINLPVTADVLSLVVAFQMMSDKGFVGIDKYPKIRDYSSYVIYYTPKYSSREPNDKDGSISSRHELYKRYQKGILYYQKIIQYEERAN